MFESQGQAKLSGKGQALSCYLCSRGFSNKAVSQSVCKRKKKQLTPSLLGGNEGYILGLKCIKGTVCIGKESCRMKRFQTPSRLQTFPLAQATSQPHLVSVEFLEGCSGSFCLFGSRDLLYQHSEMKHSTERTAGSNDSLE